MCPADCRPYIDRMRMIYKAMLDDKRSYVEELNEIRYNGTSTNMYHLTIVTIAREGSDKLVGMSFRLTPSKKEDFYAST